MSDADQHPIARSARRVEPVTRSRSRRSSLGVALLLVTAACSDPAGVTERLDVGSVVVVPGDEPVVEVPDTVDAGVPFVVEVTTYGNGCWREGPTESVVIGGRPVLTPLDWVTSGTVCEDILDIFEHTAVVVMSEPGVGFVVVRGRIGASGPIQTIEWQLLAR